MSERGPKVEAYQYDVFISYRRKAPVSEWLHNHFLPMLEQRLPDCLPVAMRPRIFVDREIETGTHWPTRLCEALKTSRCLLPIWSPEYFRSDWCLAEWKSMVKREQLLRAKKKKCAIIYPVRFADGEHFPEEAKNTQDHDVRPWNIPHAVFRETHDYIAFDRDVQEIAKELAVMIRNAPPFSDWPVVRPKPPRKAVKMGLPRL